jgi:hypothetical protein
MRELGRKGGKASVKSRLGLDVDADESLRAKARQRLHSMLDSDNPQLALRAAQSLFSYSSAKPPNELAGVEGAGAVRAMVNGKPVTIASLLEVAVFEARGVLDGELADVILKSAAEVRTRQAAGEIASTWRDVELEEGVKRFTENIERLSARRQVESGNEAA